MSSILLDRARLFLLSSSRGRPNNSETRHPWRRNWEFVVLHSLRVESYTLQILAREQQQLTERDITLLRLAAILHDIARLEQRQAHAERGAQIAAAWFAAHPNHGLESSEAALVLDMIADHSNKNLREQDFRKAVLKDADTLDEIGVMSVLMAGNWLDAQSPFFFHELRQRLIDVELPFCDQKMSILNTGGARKILGEKKAFIEHFINQLTAELQGEEQMEQTLFGPLGDDPKFL